MDRANTRLSRNKANGLTLVEVAITIAVLSVLLASAWVIGTSQRAQLVSARDAERTSDVRSIVREFERYYRINASISGPSYPTTAQVTSSLPDVLDGAADGIVYAPMQDTVSLVAATTAGTSVNPTIDQYIYQPLTINDTLCSTSPCVRFNIYYRLEQTDTVAKVESMRQQ